MFFCSMLQCYTRHLIGSHANIEKNIFKSNRKRVDRGTEKLRKKACSNSSIILQLYSQNCRILFNSSIRGNGLLFFLTPFNKNQLYAN